MAIHRWLYGIGFALLLLIFLLLQSEGQPSAVSDLPRFSLPSGVYQEDERLRLETAVSDAAILFTLDGRLPTATSPVYSQPIYLNTAQPSVVVVRARLRWPNGRLGEVVSRSYFLGLDTTLPLLSLVADPDDLWSETTGIYANPLAHGIAWERPVTAAYVAEQTMFEVDAGLRMHGQFSRSYNKKSFRLYFRQEYGQDRPDFRFCEAASCPASYKRLVVHAGGQDSTQLPTNWTLLRNQLVARLAQQTHALSTFSQPLLLFINGEPWGIYYLRERIDTFLLQEKFGAETAVLVNTPARRQEDPEPDHMGYQYWDELTHFVATHDLADPANYAQVATFIDLDNFIDYTILQIYSANYDWPVTNMHQFKATTQGGRWQWVLWDSDLSFGLKPWSDVGQNTLAQALDPSYTAGVESAFSPQDTILLRGLWQSPAFRQTFMARADELLNTTLAPEAVISEIDGLVQAVRPAILFETQRWGGKTADWESHVAQLREFAQQRPQIMRQFLAEGVGE